MSKITGHKVQKSNNGNVTVEFVNELNQFYGRSYVMNFNDEQLSLRAMLTDKCNDIHKFILSVDDVRTLFSKVNVHKAHISNMGLMNINLRTI